MNSTINNTPISQLSPSIVADEFYKSGSGIDSNPYVTGSQYSVEFALRFGKCLDDELKRLTDELKAGI